ncbi:hypothetical protein [Streptomyces sp. NBC_01314]|uniref:hypothetical protein n=1 Tax=Streptomyces sp. NBC_01314 TaxID=2903821 RepID=UPI00308752C6|nr:hypothetical protein OG622_02075 [Streptomyces sp. NBC_01314]
MDQCDWLPGTVAAVYGLPPGSPAREHLAEIAGRDHQARLARVHPAEVTYEPARLVVENEGGRVTAYTKT